MAGFGDLMLCIAAFLSALGAALAFASRGSGRLFDAARPLLYGAAAASAASMLCLVFLLITHDYSVAYVRDYADRTMSFGYLLTAVWGGQEGSLALWAALQTLFTAAAARWSLGRDGKSTSVALAFLGALQVYLLLLVIFHSNPFELGGAEAVRGIGLNPLLRNPFMALHPPTLYIGFVGFSVPLAFAVGAMAAGRGGDRVLEGQRPWILLAWVFLSIGNVLGMVWAYEELGWGGYWGWDPVENASFLPWLTGTALVHSLLARERRGVLGRWSVVFLMLTFALIIFGTFLTRSGVIQSVHSFAGATTGPYFLMLIVATLVLGCGLLIFRRRALVPERAVGGLFSKGGGILAGNIALLVAAVFVLVATMMPLFTELFSGEQISVTPSFFNRWMIPLGLIILVVMAAGGSLSWREAKNGEIERRILGPLLVGAAAASLAVLLGGANPDLGGAMTYAPPIAIGLTVFAGVSVLMAVRRTALSASRRKGFFAPSLRRKLGAQISHLAVVLMFIGFTGAGFKVEERATMTPGDRMEVGGYLVRLVGLRWDSNFEREALFADLEVTDPEGDVLGVLSPASFRYHSHPGRPTSEVAIDSSPRADVFLVLGEIDEERGAAVIRAVLNPLVEWIWFGGALLVLGVIVAVFRPGALVSLVEMGPGYRKILLKPAAAALVALLVCVPSALLDGPAFATAMLGGMILLLLLISVGEALRNLVSARGGDA